MYKIQNISNTPIKVIVEKEGEKSAEIILFPDSTTESDKFKGSTLKFASHVDALLKTKKKSKFLKIMTNYVEKLKDIDYIKLPDEFISFKIKKVF